MQPGMVIERSAAVVRQVLDVGGLVGQQVGPRIVQVDKTVEAQPNRGGAPRLDR
jgi:hypothetical protein